MTLERPEALRQSLIASFDQCPLQTRFRMESEMRQLPGAIGLLAARGVLFHRFAAAALIYMRRNREWEIPAAKALEILARVVAQREAPDDMAPSGWVPCPDEDVMLLSMRELRWLQVLVVKWSYHKLSIERLVAVERRLSAEIEVVGPGGAKYLRTVTGQPDVLLAGPEAQEATLIDWKTGFAPPAQKREPREGEAPREDRLSDMGYVQQVVYGWLVLKNYPAIEAVTEREYYVMHGEAREATVERWEMERIEDVLAGVVAQMDAAIEAGARSARWFPVGGTHCGMCPRPRDCPIKDELGIPASYEEAQRLAQEWHVAGVVRAERLPYLKGYVDEHGPIEVPHSKGRRAVGWTRNKTGEGRSFRLYEPEEAPESPLDPLLEEAARERGVLVDA
jgi:PD-(D/E)XK nuclease superfamily